MMKISTMVIDLRAGVVYCNAEMCANGVTTSVTFSIQESKLIEEARLLGRYTWDNEDVIRIGSEAIGSPITDL